jgi:hypothetical protein
MNKNIWNNLIPENAHQNKMNPWMFKQRQIKCVNDVTYYLNSVMVHRTNERIFAV